MREHWRDLDYWLWLWRQRMPPQAKFGIVALLLAILLGGGWLTADRLTAANASSSTDSFVFETTVNKVITVREKGKLVTKVIPVVHRIVRVRAKTETAYGTQLRYATRVVTTPGGVRVVRRVVTTMVPVVKTKVVRVNGKTRTVAVTSFVPTTRTETQVQATTETRQQTVTNTQTQPPGTITQTNTHTTTQTQTETQTQTQTVTQTQTQTQTQTVVQTVTDTQTVTLPPITITETVTTTVPGGP